MWAYNKYNVGEIVSFKDTPILEFQVCEILCGVPEKPTDYLYSCKLIVGRSDQIGKVFNYQEKNLSFVRKGTLPELEELLKTKNMCLQRQFR
jgi:hypothetical protein